MNTIYVLRPVLSPALRFSPASGEIEALDFRVRAYEGSDIVTVEICGRTEVAATIASAKACRIDELSSLWALLKVKDGHYQFDRFYPAWESMKQLAVIHGTRLS